MSATKSLQESNSSACFIVTLSIKSAGQTAGIFSARISRDGEQSILRCVRAFLDALRSPCIYISIQQDRIVQGGNNQKETKDGNADQERHLSLTVTESVLITYGDIIGEHKYFDQAAVYLIE